MSENKYLNLSLYNSKEEPINANINANYSSPILENPQGYDIAVSRLKLPSSLIESFVSEDNNKYKVTLGIPYFSTDESTGGSHKSTRRLVLGSGGNEDEFSPSVRFGSHRIFSEQSFLESVNRTIANLYYDVIKDIFTQSPNVTSGALHHFPYQTSGTVSFAIPNSSTTNTRFLGLTLDIFLPFDINFPFRMFLQAPNNGKKVLVFSGESMKAITAFYSFRDYAHRSITEISHIPAQSSGSGIQELYLPAESFFDFAHTTDLNGLWSLVLETNNNASFNHTITTSLRVYSTNDSNFPNLPPSFRFDEQDKLVLDYQYGFQNYGGLIGFSPFLKELFSFGDKNSTYNSSDNVHYLTLPPINLNDDLDVINSFKQYLSTKYLFTNVDTIELSASGLATDSDILLADTTNSILTDFSIDYETDMSVLIFSATSKPFKRYRIETNRAINSFNLSVFIKYKSGERRLAQISPGENLQIILQMSKE